MTTKTKNKIKGKKILTKYHIAYNLEQLKQENKMTENLRINFEKSDMHVDLNSIGDWIFEYKGKRYVFNTERFIKLLKKIK